MDREYVNYLLDQLAPLGEVRARAMFGGFGVYLDRVMFGLVADNAFYLKVDEENRPHFEAAGSEPFVYHRKGKPMAMSYWLLPEAAADDREAMLEWARLGIQAALRARR
ncbi:TfoX/Sxy family protein [Ectothiorhodospiraceae bacterium WFHF3C12]|nr:TfoX/Sxy family protein [Ectothiorhodospiraceae bacterium WFHF3C12]